MTMTDGSQNHRTQWREEDGDRGCGPGGMACYCMRWWLTRNKPREKEEKESGDAKRRNKPRAAPDFGKDWDATGAVPFSNFPFSLFSTRFRRSGWITCERGDSGDSRVGYMRNSVGGRLPKTDEIHETIAGCRKDRLDGDGDLLEPRLLESTRKAKREKQEEKKGVHMGRVS